jgi:Beta-lactamase enzyme family
MRVRQMPLAGAAVALALALTLTVTAATAANAASTGGTGSTARASSAGQAAASGLPAARSELATCSSAAGRHRALAARLAAGITAALRGRGSVVGLAVDDRRTGVSCRLHSGWHFASASVVKVTILGALLRKLKAEHRYLTRAQVKLTTEMITESDNAAASALWAEVGRRSMQRFLDLAGMSHTRLGLGGYWGLTQITAHDELTLLKLLTGRNRVLDRAARDYALKLMAEVIPAQRWGVPAGAPADLTVHVKDGWLPLAAHGWHINSIGSFSGHGRDYMIVVLTLDNPTMGYGVETIQDVAEVINRDLNPGAAPLIPAARPGPSWGTADEHLPAAAIRER